MTLPARIRREPRLGMKERIRSPGHLNFVRSHDCCVTGCNGRPIHAHHVLKGNQARSLKPGDDKAISLCAAHHNEAHAGEVRFEQLHGLNLLTKAAEFVRASPHRRKLGVSCCPSRRPANLALRSLNCPRSRKRWA